jgi:two-component system, cell cycle response regulator
MAATEPVSQQEPEPPPGPPIREPQAGLAPVVRPFRSIASSLIRGTVVLATALLLVVLGAQSWLLVRNHSAQFQMVVDDIAATAVPLLSVGLWDIELQAVQQQIDLIAQRPQVGHVRLKTPVGKEFSAGRMNPSDSHVSVRLPIAAPAGAPNSAGTVVGELSISGNQRYLIDQVLQNAWTMFIAHAAFTAALCIFIASMLRRELQDPMRQIARFAAQLKPHSLTQPFALWRPGRRVTDEIDQLADGFAKLQTGLRDHIDQLDRRVEERTAQLKDLAEANRVLSITDDLTGCFNRRSLEARLREEVGRSRRYGRSLSVISLDLDHFKRINDTHGHAVGDTVLRQVGGFLRGSVRVNLDWVVRMGGEEFLLVLPETDLRSAGLFAQRLHAGLGALRIEHPGGLLQITASMGVAQLRDGEDGQRLILRADALLYTAKDAGRNQVQYEAVLPPPTRPAPLA